MLLQAHILSQVCQVGSLWVLKIILNNTSSIYSFFGFCCTTYLTILVLVEYIKVEQKQHVPPTINVGPEKWNDIFK